MSIVNEMERVADPVDRATLEAEIYLEQAISQTLAKADEKLPYKGSCYYCHEPLPKPLRFCDIDSSCRDEYDYMQQRRQINMRV